MAVPYELPSSQCVALLRWLQPQPSGRARASALPRRLKDATLLTVADADGLIEFGCRNHCFIGPPAQHKLHFEQGWSFCSVTGPNKKPMRDIFREDATADGQRP